MSRLAIICTHPIQYYTPVFKMLARVIELKVFYTSGEYDKFDTGFGINIDWDIPLLDGYDFQFLINTAKNRGTHHFFGVINQDAIKMIGKFKPDSILIYGWAHHSHFKILHYFKGKVPILFRGDSIALDQHHPLRSIARKVMLNYIYRHIDHAFYAGTNNKHYFNKYGLKTSQLTFVPHAVDNKRFACNEDVLQIRKKLRLTETDVLILFAGKFTAIKNPTILLKAFDQLQLLNSQLLLVGDGPMKSHLEAKYKNKKIHFMPFQNQSVMPSVYKSCDLFCIPSKSETWGLAVNEAMAAGKAILASDMVGSATDLVKSSNGLIFQSGCLKDLKQKLAMLVTNRADLKRKGWSSIAIIKNWNFETQVKNITGALPA